MREVYQLQAPNGEVFTQYTDDVYKIAVTNDNRTALVYYKTGFHKTFIGAKILKETQNDVSTLSPNS